MVLFSRYYRVRPRCKVTNTNTNSGPLGANTKRIERRGCGGGGVRCVVKVICAVGGGALVHFVVFVIEKKEQEFVVNVSQNGIDKGSSYLCYCK